MNRPSLYRRNGTRKPVLNEEQVNVMLSLESNKNTLIPVKEYLSKLNKQIFEAHYDIYGELCNLMLDDGSILIDNRVNGDQCSNRYPHPDHDNLLKRLKTATKEYNKACSFIAAMEIDKSNLLTMEEIQIKHSSAIKFINGLKLKTLIIESK